MTIWTPHRSTSRTAFLLAALSACALPHSAFAQTAGDSDEGEVQIIGSVAPICSLGEPSDAVVDLGVLIDLSGPRVGRTASITPRQVTMPGSFCNYANTMISITASAMTEQTGAPLNTGFSRAVNYRVSVSPWSATEADLLTSAASDGSGLPGNANSSSQPLPKISDLTMELADFAAPSDALLVAGEYSGLITVTLGPANDF
ncbi:hypothetical protein [Pontixanthobacter luteolus]|uniref:hypothetical protein n=1 Tax=Pontixanthobacter luteolus TaxID=295089 RepID=UPI0023024BAA|nr:hypothetical protein [Pontixanthobacter luteolus]